MIALAHRVWRILLRPEAEWAAIEREPYGAGILFGYVAILALIPAIASFVGASIVGVTVSVGTFRVPMLAGFVSAAIGYGLSFVTVYLVALLIDLLAPTFGAQRKFGNALKLAAYSYTPAWLAGCFFMIPSLRVLSFLGLYGCYLLWAGLGPMMRTPRDRTLLYAIAVICGALALAIAFGVLQAILTAYPRLMRY